jgi:serine/threonine protein kinase
MLLQSRDLETCARTEVESFQRFHHPNILPLISFTIRPESGRGEGSGRAMYMLFPLVENGSLRNILNRRERQLATKPKLREVLTDFTAICEALNVLHSFQPSYVHQDIKPEVPIPRPLCSFSPPLSLFPAEYSHCRGWNTALD